MVIDKDFRGGGAREGCASPHTPFPPAAAGQPGETNGMVHGGPQALHPSPPEGDPVSHVIKPLLRSTSSPGAGYGESGFPHTLLMVLEKFIRYTGLAVGLMVFEKFIRSAGLAVGLKPSARGCEGRLRGLERMMYSKTIRPRLRDAKPACAGESGVCIQRSLAAYVHVRRSSAWRTTPAAHGPGARVGRARHVSAGTVTAPSLTLPRWAREPGSSPQRGEAGRGAERGARWSPQPSMRLRRTTPQ